MRAATQTSYGAPTVLETTDVARPAVGPRQILVEVGASVVTQGDRRMRAADFPGISAVFGRLMMGVTKPRNRVPGSMLAGRVVAVGPEVTRFVVGDDVFASVMHGAYAEYIALAEDEPVAKMPAHLTYAEAAALPYGAGTAIAFLRDMAQVQPGERVLIHGASGGVGRFAVQIAKHLGAEVTAVCSRDQDLVRELGADHVIDYTQEDFTKNGERYDVILDTVEGNRFRAVRGSLTRAGRYLSLYMTVGLVLSMGLSKLRRGPRAMAGVALPGSALLDDVRALSEAGAIRAVIARRYPLERLAEAHAFLERGRTRGSVVIDVAEAVSAPQLRVA